MAYSNSVSMVKFNVRKVIDMAFWRCRIAPQLVTAEMQNMARDNLYLMLSSMANPKAPSWCIEKILLPMYENQQIVPLPVGTVMVMNANYRSLQLLSGTVSEPAGYYVVEFESPTRVTTVGVWRSQGSSIAMPIEVSNNGSSWTQVGEIPAEPDGSGSVKTWYDIGGAVAYSFIRLTVDPGIVLDEVILGNTPNEIPLGVLNQDQYVNQNNKVFPSRPNTYWFQRDLPVPVMNIWPAPNPAATFAQIVVYRQRHIMDVGSLTSEPEVPQRWLEAIIDGLASKVAMSLPQVPLNLITILESRAARSLADAWAGDNDGSSTQINPGISPYTR